MADYLEIQSLEELGSASNLRNKIRVALQVKARSIAVAPKVVGDEPKRAWAIAALSNPQQYEALTLRFIGVSYGVAAPLGILQTGLSLEQIATAQDADVQVAVNTVVDTLLGQ
jgi:hypothetical protein